MKKYPSLNEQIKEFGIVRIFGNKLLKEYFIESKEEYNHDSEVLHHYILEQEYYRYPERYKGLQKLILIPKEMHNDIHSSMRDIRFKEKWHIEKSDLLYTHRKF